MEKPEKITNEEELKTIKKAVDFLLEQTTLILEMLHEHDRKLETLDENQYGSQL